MNHREKSYLKMIESFLQLIIQDENVSIEFKTKLLELRKQL